MDAQVIITAIVNFISGFVEVIVTGVPNMGGIGGGDVTVTGVPNYTAVAVPIGAITCFFILFMMMNES